MDLFGEELLILLALYRRRKLKKLEKVLGFSGYLRKDRRRESITILLGKHDCITWNFLSVVPDDSLSTREIDRMGSSFDCQRQFTQGSNFSYRMVVCHSEVLGKQ